MIYKTIIRLFLILLSFQINAQIQMVEKDHFFVEANFSIGENPIKRDLQVKLGQSERTAFNFNVETLIGYVYKSKWFAEAGLHYAKSKYRNSQIYEIEISNPDEELIFENDFQISLTNSFKDLESNVKIEINQESCHALDYINDGDLFEGHFQTENIVKTIGIPIRIGRFIGTKKFRVFTSIGLIPQFVIKKTVKANRGHEPITTVGFNHNEKNCWTDMGSQKERVQVTTETTSKKWNIQDKRLDLVGEIGLIHKIKSNYFKIGIYYGEAITPFSKTNISKYKLKTYGLKFGFALI